MGKLASALVVLAGLMLPAAPAPAAGPSSPKIVYLTFDDGPNAGNDPRLLRVLRRAQVPATFFMVGRSLALDPGAVARLYLAGHAIGNHSWSHTDLTTLSPAGIDAELRGTQRLFRGAGGACVRPPYGAVNATVMSEAARLGMRVVLWDVDPQDWAHQDTPYIVTQVMTHVRDRSIVLLHDGGGVRSATISAVKQLIPLLRAKGYEFRTVPACRVPSRTELLGASRPAGKRPTPQPTPTQPNPTQPQPTPSAPEPSAPGAT